MSEPADIGIYNIDQKYDNKESKKKEQKRSQEPDPAVFVSDGAGVKSLHPIKLCFVGGDQMEIVLLSDIIRGQTGIRRWSGGRALVWAWLIVSSNSGHDPAIGVWVCVLYVSRDIPMHRGLRHMRFQRNVLIGLSGFFLQLLRTL